MKIQQLKVQNTTDPNLIDLPERFREQNVQQFIPQTDQRHSKHEKRVIWWNLSPMRHDLPQRSRS